MATVPVRSQPLHNFSLPFLKWGKNQMNNQRCRKSSVDSSQEFQPPLDHHHNRSSSSASETESDREIELENRKNPIISSSSSRSVKHHQRLPSSSYDILMVEKKNNPTMLESEATAGGGVEQGKFEYESPLSVEKKKKKKKKKKPSSSVVVDVLDAGVAAAGGGEIEDSSAMKPWNLRPRRVVFKANPIEIEGSSREMMMQQQQQQQQLHQLQEKASENLPKSLRLRGVSAEGGVQNVEKKKEKQKFWISLSREEIEEDFFIMTGSKPSRRPKKRARNIQKQVDNAFPGLWLAGITADSYIVPDVPAKR